MGRFAFQQVLVPHMRYDQLDQHALNVDSFKGDRYSHEIKMCATNCKIKMNIATAAFIKSADSALIVRMYEQMSIVEAL